MKLAILGTGKIVQEGALPAIQQADGIDTVAIFARPKSQGKAEQLAARYGIPQVYTDYEALLANPGIEFVYVGLINSVHYEYTKKALLAGKNVIVESHLPRRQLRCTSFAHWHARSIAMCLRP